MEPICTSKHRTELAVSLLNTITGSLSEQPCNMVELLMRVVEDFDYMYLMGKNDYLLSQKD